MQYGRLTVNIEPEQLAALGELAERHQLSASFLARQALKFLLKNPALFLPPVHSDTTHHGDKQYVEAAR